MTLAVEDYKRMRSYLMSGDFRNQSRRKTKNKIKQRRSKSGMTENDHLDFIFLK